MHSPNTRQLPQPSGRMSRHGFVGTEPPGGRSANDVVNSCVEHQFVTCLHIHKIEIGNKLHRDACGLRPASMILYRKSIFYWTYACVLGNIYISLRHKVYFIGLMSLSEVIKSRRKTLAISQRDLAEMAGVGLATIKDIERGKGNPSMGNVSRIMEILGMEIVFKVRQTI